MAKLSQAEIDTYMQAALLEARKAAALGEVPIGAVVVYEGKIIGRGFNLREYLQDGTQHAEMLAITEANRQLQSWRLPGAQLFVTLEPCVMCAGLIQQTRIESVYYAAADPKAGAVESLYHILDDERLNHQVEVHTGVYEAEASQMLKAFFKAIRQRKKAEKRARNV